MVLPQVSADSPKGKPVWDLMIKVILDAVVKTLKPLGRLWHVDPVSRGAKQIPQKLALENKHCCLEDHQGKLLIPPANPTAENSGHSRNG